MIMKIEKKNENSYVDWLYKNTSYRNYHYLYIKYINKVTT